MFSSSTSSLLLLATVLGLLSSPARAGDEWVRATAYRDGGDVPGATDQTALEWSVNKEVWSYYFGKAESPGWFSENPVPLVWDEQWFQHPDGQWAKADDEVPAVNRETLHLGLAGTVGKRSGIIRWRNSFDRAVTIRIDGDITVSWHSLPGQTPSRYPDLEFVVAVVDRDGIAGEPLQSSVLTQEANDRSPLPIQIAEVRVPAGGSIVFAARPVDLADDVSWVNLKDNLVLHEVE